MFTRHISRQLAAYLDGQLTPSKAQQAKLHLSECLRCRAESEQVAWGMAGIEHLPHVEAPEAIWLSLEAAFQDKRSRPPRPNFRWRWASAAIVGLALAIAVTWYFGRSPVTRWEVIRLDGSPRVGSKWIGGTGQIAAGEWIETDVRSRAVLKVGRIGSVEVSPNTRLRILTARPDEHRLTLARGEIRAKIAAPPKLFFVETASGTVVDLGCEYALTVDGDSAGLLRVTSGWVSFQWKGLESLVPAGASCRMVPQAGPGIPYFDDASKNLKRALEKVGYEKGANDAVNIILSESRVRDTLTLWHLLSRVDMADRERVFDRMAALTPVPAGVSRTQALLLDPQTLEHWREELAWTW
jgi:hypothetical protein